MIGVELGRRHGCLAWTGPDGLPQAFRTRFAVGRDGLDAETALRTLLDAAPEHALPAAGAADRTAHIGLSSAAGWSEAELRQAVKHAGLTAGRVVPDAVAVALHYGAVAEGVDCTVLICHQGVPAPELTLLSVTPDLTVHVVRSRGYPDDVPVTGALTRELAPGHEPVPDVVLLSGALGAPDTAARVEALPAAQGLTVRCHEPDTAVARGLLRLGGFVVLRVGTGPATRSPGAYDYVPPVPPDHPRVRVTASEPGIPLEDPDPLTTPAEQQPRPQPVPASVPEPEPSPEPTPGTAANDAPPAVPRPRTGQEQSAPPPSGNVPPPVVDVPPPAPEPSVATGFRELFAVPVAELMGIRRGDHLLVAWAWPEGALTTRVRWKADAGSCGELLCPRRTYEQDGGLDLDLGRGSAVVTVEALVADPGVIQEGSAGLVVPALPPLVEYEPAVRRRLRGRLATVTFSCPAGCRLPDVRVVHSLGHFRPTSVGEGTVVYEVPAQRLDPGTPLTVEFPLPAVKGPSWLACFPAHADPGPPGSDPDADPGPGIDLRPTALHRLRVT